MGKHLLHSLVSFLCLILQVGNLQFANLSVGVAEAEKALNSVNGTFIRNKPVIIQFGKRTPI